MAKAMQQYPSLPSAIDCGMLHDWAVVSGVAPPRQVSPVELPAHVRVLSGVQPKVVEPASAQQ